MTVLEGLWWSPPADLTLSRSKVHVWRASLDQPGACVERLARVLSPDERARADRFRFVQDRQRFIVGRGVLRTILSRYVGVESSGLRFRYESHGKPALDGPLGPGTVRFNVAHSQALALYAITEGRDIGVDLESLRPIPDAEEIAGRFFSPRENAVFHEVPFDLKTEAFLNCWTRKEAFVKALGDGLTHPLDRFDVSLAPGEPARLLWVEAMPEAVFRWSLRELAPAPGYIAALAVEGHDWHLACWDWDE